MGYDEVMEIAVRRGFLWPSAEIYGGVSGFYDFGPLGSLLKRRIEDTFRDYFLFGEGFHEIQSPNIMPEDVFVASGHLDCFSDYMSECMKCGEPYRVDHLIKEKAKIETDGLTVGDLEELIKRHNITCPKCKGHLDKIWSFKLMFKTEIGPGKNSVAGYLRPETAQGIFIAFRRLFEYGRRKLPLGIMQIGKSFRNEISPRQGMLRLREFHQAEIEIFVDPEQKNSHPRFASLAKDKLRLYSTKEQAEGKKETEMTLEDAVKKGVIRNQYVGYYLALSTRMFKELGIPESDMRCRQHLDTERAHYASDTWDVEISTHFGWVEVVGIADRGEYDLTSHQKLSKQSMEVSIDGRKFVPHVIEPSYGIDRIFYCILEKAYSKEERGWEIFKFSNRVAPYQVAVYALVNREGMDTKSQEIYKQLLDEKFNVVIDNSGSIGRRYARADEIGTPYCLTVDGDTLKDGTVTIRSRDTQKQVRAKANELVPALKKLLSGKAKLEDVGKPL
ncbi:MAG: glycine--tRNA ligase [archaeon]